MKKVLIVAGILAVGAILLFMMYPKQEATTDISVDTLRDELAAGEIVLLDVREPDEYETGHITEALNVPLSTFEADSLTYEKTEPIYVICRSGNRSAQAAALLAAAGYTTIYNVDGGMIAWEALSN